MSRHDDVKASKNREVGPSDREFLAILGAISGGLSAGSFLYFTSFVRDARVEQAGALVVPGIVYAAAVMIPFRGVVTYWWPRLAFAAMCCAVAHTVALSLVSSRAFTVDSKSPVVSTLTWFMAGGAIGSLLAGKGLLVVLGRPWRYRTLAAMVAAGSVSSLAFVILWYGGYPIWQAVEAATLGGLLKELRAARPGEPAGGRPS